MAYKLTPDAYKLPHLFYRHDRAFYKPPQDAQKHLISLNKLALGVYKRARHRAGRVQMPTEVLQPSAQHLPPSATVRTSLNA